MWLVGEALPSLTVAFPWPLQVAVGCAAMGCLTALAGVVALCEARTTVNPTAPEASSTMVASGVYRWSRNPMYLGFLLAIVGWGVHLANVVALVLIPAFVMYIGRFQIKPEERALAAKFGAQYIEYARKVRRWL
jgi:protein-S-isoprenylcysteine O-methyltransferase Ste14